MNISNYKNFALFDYENNTDGTNVFNLGDVVINKAGEVGVIIQLHDRREVRTDQFGNACENYLKFATLEQITASRPDILAEKIKELNSELYNFPENPENYMKNLIC